MAIKTRIDRLAHGADQRHRDYVTWKTYATVRAPRRSGAAAKVRYWSFQPNVLGTWTVWLTRHSWSRRLRGYPLRRTTDSTSWFISSLTSQDNVMLTV